LAAEKGLKVVTKAPEKEQQVYTEGRPAGGPQATRAVEM